METKCFVCENTGKELVFLKCIHEEKKNLYVSDACRFLYTERISIKAARAVFPAVFLLQKAAPVDLHPVLLYYKI